MGKSFKYLLIVLYSWGGLQLVIRSIPVIPVEIFDYASVDKKHIPWKCVSQNYLHTALNKATKDITAE